MLSVGAVPDPAKMAAKARVEVVIPRQPRDGTNRRQLSVDEALQYTPMTTSILPSHDRISIPQIGPPGHIRLTTPAERQAAYRNEHYTQQTRERLATLLDPNHLSEIKFKRSAVPTETPVKSNLNPIQELVLRLTDVEYTHPSSVSPHSHVKKESPDKAVPRSSQASVIVEIPQPPPSFRRNEYVAMPDSPKRRKLAESESNDKLALALASKKEKDDQLLANLENQLVEIFEAQDRLAPDTSAATTGFNNTIFDVPDEEDEAEPRLTIATHEKLQGILSKVVASGRLADASTEYIQRLQQLCEPAIEAAQTVNLRVPSNASPEDLGIWLAKIHKAESGAAAACTLIYTVLGAAQNTDLVNLEVLQWFPNVLVNVFENCLIPVIEARPDGPESGVFEMAIAHSDSLRKLMDVGRRLLELVATVCVQVKGAGSTVNATEFLASKLIFVQNAPTDKAAALGAQTYERMRKQAMAVLAKLYAAFPGERAAILDEVLTSLDKLPSNSRSARQYKLGSGKSIQLVSALFMQLVQTPAMQTGKNTSPKRRRQRRNLSQELLESDDADSASDNEMDHMAVSEENEPDPVSKLAHTADALFDDAFKSAQQIVGWMVDKASKVTKTGDSPYRNILDLFVEDLTVVLPSTDWPASELLLTVLALRMITLAKTDKAASTKNMALESLGVMGSAISELRETARNLLSSILRDSESSSSKIGQELSHLVRDRSHFFLQNDELIAPGGPFAIVHSYLMSKRGESLRTKSAKAYFLVQYATLIARTLHGPQNDDQEPSLEKRLSPTVTRILQQLAEPDEIHPSIEEDIAVTNQEAQLAYLLSVLNMRFCRRFQDIAKTLASSLSSDQAQVRSRSLKSVVTILETDSSLLDWDPSIADDVFKCASDDSSLVRDSALSLIARFILPRQGLEEKAFRRLLKCAGDANIGVQKRAMGHLKDIYLKESRQNMKVTIAIEFLRRTADQEESVAELARKTLADIWFAPNLAILANADETAQAAVAVENFKAQIVACINSDTAAMAPLLKDFLVWKLKDSKQAEQVHELCARIVKKLLDTANGSEAGPADLTTLVAFAEARPQTVVPSDLASLKSYLKDLSKSDNILKFKSVVAIFRSVLPHLSKTQEPLLQEVQLDLMKAAKNLARRQELEEVMSCLRSIDGVLHNTGRIVAFAKSIMQNVIQPRIAPQLKEQLIKANQTKELQARENKVREQSLRLAGTVAKHIDLENFRKTFQADFPSFKAGPVAGFIADSILPFTFKGPNVELRLKALESLGLVCQAWPGQLNKQHIRETFFQILDGTSSTTLQENDLLKMQLIVLGIFDELYANRVSTRTEPNQTEGAVEAQALKNIGGDSKTREDDSAISTITNPLVDRLLRIVMSEAGEKALLAAQTLASIDHQGMTHPKQSTAAFVALETNPDLRIANVARIAHGHLHQQHESVCEREYIHAVFEAFRYQKEVFKDPRGATVPGFKAKLSPAFSIINTSGSKYVKKFLSNLISKLNTEYSKLSINDEEIPEHVLFVLFVTQNLAFFEYKKMDELLHAVLQLELVFGKTGGETAQAIESHIRPIVHEPADTGETSEVMQDGQMDAETSVDPLTLRRMAAAACAITLISEARNYLKRQYGLSRDIKMAMQHNKQTKESVKEPVKVHGITGDKYWNSSNAVLESLASREMMIARCREFVNLVAVDDEVKIAEEEGEAYPVNSMVAQPSTNGVRGRKRKSTDGSMGGTPKRPRGRPKNNAKRRSSSVSSMDGPEGEFAGAPRFVATQIPARFVRRAAPGTLRLISTKELPNDRGPIARFFYRLFAYTGIFIIGCGALVVAFFIYDASTYKETPEAVGDVPVSEAALSPRRGGPKNLPIAEILVDDEDSEEMREQKHKPKLVILGTGWGSVAMLKELNPGDYHVTVVSPENYFLFTPMLPSATVGTLELRSLVEPVRRIVNRLRGHFLRARAVDVEFSEKLVEVAEIDANGQERHFYLPYDKLVIGVGSTTNPHGVKGLENCNFLKTIEDARLIKNKILQNLELACLPTTTDEERRRLLSFVISGGGPTGVEFAAELYDMLNEDLLKSFPKILRNEISVHVIQSRGHILNTYDEALSIYAEKRFERDHVEVLTNSRVKEVKPDSIIFSQMEDGKAVTKELPMGFCLWSTGVAQTDLSKKIAQKLGDFQNNRHALETDSHLRLIGAPLGDVYAIGDCATVQNNIADHLTTFLRGIAFEKGKDPDKVQITFQDWRGLAHKVRKRFPQAAGHLKRLDRLFEEYDKDKSGTLDFGELHELLVQIDSKLTSLPATAQRANQQGQYLGRKFNKIAAAIPGFRANEVDFGDLDEAVYKAFEYRHMGSLAYIGNAAIFDFGGLNFSGGLLAVYLWRSIYFAESVSFRTRLLLAMDWSKRALFGRDLVSF
ncbi:NADH-ubiquinone oxidoreductase subunit, partial [Aureobasidium melanogenum]